MTRFRRLGRVLYHEARYNSIPYLFVMPALAILTVFLIAPAVQAFRMSFYDWKLLSPSTFTGLTNYRDFFSYPNVLLSVRNTLYFAVLSVPGTVATALFFAILLNEHIRGRRFFRVLFYLPVIASDVAVSLLWKWVYWAGKIGILNHILVSVGLPPQDWLGNPDLAMPAVAILSIWKGMGTYVIIFLAGLQSIPPELYEAGRIDGAGPWPSFRHLTLPLLRPIVLLVVLLLTISSLQVFTPIMVMTGGGPANSTITIAFYIYNLAFAQGRYGLAAAVSYILFAGILAITIVQRRLLGQEVGY